jgi:hypothetical protein
VTVSRATVRAPAATRGPGAGTLTIMPTPSRPLPRVGAPVRIRHFGGASEPGTVVAVGDGGRHVRVRGEDGEVREFVLSPARARFVSADSPHGPRLDLLA